MRRIDLGWIRVFVEVARAGSLSVAARTLNLSQPAVSYQIRRIETEFGVRLLHRQHRGVELTEAGAKLYDILSRSVTQVDQLALRLRQSADKTVLRLFTDYAFSGLWLIPRIHAFRESAPGVELQIIASQGNDLSQLQENDTAVIFGTRQEMGPEATLLMPETVVPVCAPGYAFRSIAEAELIHLDSQGTTRWFDWSSYLSAMGLQRDLETKRGNMRFNTYSLVMDAAVAGQGVALGWRGLVDTLLRREALVEIGPDLVAPDRGYFIVQGPARREAAHALRAWMLSA